MRQQRHSCFFLKFWASDDIKCHYAILNGNKCNSQQHLQTSISSAAWILNFCPVAKYEMFLDRDFGRNDANTENGAVNQHLQEF